ncbi:hypothetical protein [Novosphingobium rosa]|uniref:hypothetical protein n=1 Tax=Novosphingobium rosa TaxID=76978 RepID=UPI00082F7063|nr:hypothetical protein [Novosphingobium rosa]
MTASLLATAAVPAAAQSSHDWRSYVNARFGYTVCYPADLLHPQREADNGDGREFTGAHGAVLRVWSSYNALEATVPQARAEDVKRFTGQGYRITYQVAKPGWYVLSGAGRAGTFYKRRMLNKDRDLTFELLYPSSDAAIWNPVAAKLNACLKG